MPGHPEGARRQCRGGAPAHAPRTPLLDGRHCTGGRPAGVGAHRCWGRDAGLDGRGAWWDAELPAAPARGPGHGCARVPGATVAPAAERRDLTIHSDMAPVNRVPRPRRDGGHAAGCSGGRFPACRGLVRGRLVDGDRGQQPDDVAGQAAGQQQQALVAGGGDGGGSLSGAGVSCFVIDGSIAIIGPRPRTSRCRPLAASASRRSRIVAPSVSARRGYSGVATVSSTAIAAAQATGLPPNVPPRPPGATASISSARPVTAASGSPPPSDLPRDQQVRLDAVVLDRPHRARAADAGLDLVVDVQDPVVRSTAPSTGEGSLSASG